MIVENQNKASFITFYWQVSFTQSPPPPPPKKKKKEKEIRKERNRNSYERMEVCLANLVPG